MAKKSRLQVRIEEQLDAINATMVDLQDGITNYKVRLTALDERAKVLEDLLTEPETVTNAKPEPTGEETDVDPEEEQELDEEEGAF